MPLPQLHCGELPQQLLSSGVPCKKLSLPSLVALRDSLGGQLLHSIADYIEMVASSNHGLKTLDSRGKLYLTSAAHTCKTPLKASST